MTNSKAPTTCIVIGAGISGILAARKLHEAGVTVTVIDKGRNLGGRMATRLLSGARLDHGAQSIALDRSHAADIFKPLIDGGVLRPWYGDFASTHYYSTDGMSGIARHLAADLDVRLESKVTRLAIDNNNHWTVYCDGNQSYTADMLMLTPPAPQSLALLEESGIDLDKQASDRLHAIKYDKCLTLMALFDKPLKLTRSGWLKSGNPAAEWIADSRSKGMAELPAITVQASSAFSEEHFDSPEPVVVNLIQNALAPFTDFPPTSQKLHRWRYSRAIVTDREHCLATLSPAPLAFAGDGFADQQITGAAQSGIQAAESLIELCRITPQ